MTDISKYDKCQGTFYTGRPLSGRFPTYFKRIKRDLGEASMLCNQWLFIRVFHREPYSVGPGNFA